MLNEILILSRVKEIQRISNNSMVNKLAKDIERAFNKDKPIYSEDEIIFAVCKHFGVDIDELFDSIRSTGNMSYARPIYCYLYSENVSNNQRVIKNAMKRKSQTSVAQYLMKFNDLIDTHDQIFLTHYNSILTILQNESKEKNR